MKCKHCIKMSGLHEQQAEQIEQNKADMDKYLNQAIDMQDEIQRLKELIVKLHKVGFGNLYNVEKNRILALAAQPQKEVSK